MALKIQVLSFFWKHPVFWFCFLVALNKFTLPKSTGELCLSYLLRVFLRAPIYISIYKMTTQALEEETWARFRSRYGDTREDVSVVIRPSLPCTTCLQTISCFFWSTVFSPNANTYPVGNLLTNRDIPHSKKAEKIVSWGSRAGAPSPLACLPRTPRGSFWSLVLSSVCHAGYVLTGALRGACFVSFVIFSFCF